MEADYILREGYFETPNRIPMVGTWGRMPSAAPTDSWLHIKSTAASLTDAWIGFGVLENRGGRQIETILSKSQLEAVADKIGYVENTDAELKRVSGNFKKIAIMS